MKRFVTSGHFYNRYATNSHQWNRMMNFRGGIRL